MTLKARLAKHIQETLASGVSDLRIEDDTPLIDKGIVDSIGLMEVVMFIEQETGVRVPDEEIAPDNFQTVASMEEMVQRLQKRSGSRAER
jgi:acyl carrier protein